MKLKKQAIVFLVLSLVMLFSTAFAWFNLSKIGDIGAIDSNITDFSDLIDFYVKRSDDQDFVKISTIVDMHNAFGSTEPGEYYEFKIEFKNHTGADRTFIVELKDILTNYIGSTDHDLRDVFYISGGKAYVSFYDLLTNTQIGNTTESTLSIISSDPIFKFNQTLDDYRLNNLTKSTNNNIIIAQIPQLPADQKAVVTFTLVYDPDTYDILYQVNQLMFSGIYIYGQ